MAAGRAPGSPDLDAVRAVLGGVMDPEVPVLSILDLGIVRDVRAEDGFVVVALTPTYTGCPATAAIQLDVARALDAAGFARHRVETVLAPAWTTDWMTDAGREKLRAYGIAPPEAGGGRASLLGLEAVPVCPRCASARTEEISRFGSTACKALWRCIDCREPFDRFKCI